MTRPSRDGSRSCRRGVSRPSASQPDSPCLSITAGEEARPGKTSRIHSLGASQQVESWINRAWNGGPGPTGRVPVFLACFGLVIALWLGDALALIRVRGPAVRIWIHAFAATWRASGPCESFGDTLRSHKRRGQGARVQDGPSPIQASATQTTAHMRRSRRSKNKGSCRVGATPRCVSWQGSVHALRTAS